MNDAPLGLIAGEGIFPLLVARGARRRGGASSALRSRAAPGLTWKKNAMSFPGSACRGSEAGFASSARPAVSEAIMVGRVTKTRMYRRFAFVQYIPDLRTARMFLARFAVTNDPPRSSTPLPTNSRQRALP